MEEIWKDINGYEGLYQVSNLGNVRSVDRYVKNGSGLRLIKGRKKINQKINNGYVVHGLYKGNKRKVFLLHRLVWETFNKQVPDGYEINHIDENKENNRLENLVLVTHKENCNWGTRNIRQKEKVGKKIIQYTLDGKFVNEYQSAREIERKTGFNYNSILRCCRGIYRQSYNYIWKFKNV